MTTAAILTCALLLDAIFGEPRWLWSRGPHPAVLMGRLVALGDRWLNNRTKFAGGVLAAGLVLFGGSLGYLLSQLGAAFEIIAAAILLAQRSLVEHVYATATGLRQSLTAGRRSVRMIVSRNTDDMQAPHVARAAIESGAENMSDGVIAPALFFLVFGLPGMLIYKLINTADSMIGYRTDRYNEFGWATAKLDDVFNWIPARITAALFWVVGGFLGRWSDIIKDARLHKSPNAGWPEAALSRGLGVALAGPRSYHGILQDLPWVNAHGKRDIGAAEIEASCLHLWRAWGLFVILCLGIALTF